MFKVVYFISVSQEDELMIGKLPPDLLRKLVLENAFINDPSVLLGPQIGEDAAVIYLGGDTVLVTHSDTISAAEELIGWLSIHVVANDIAVTGARPNWFLLNLMVPPSTEHYKIGFIMKEVKEAVNELGASVVGGHTEYTEAVNKPLTVTAGMGLTSRNKFVRTGGAKPGDAVLMTKYAGLEGTAILATDFRDLLAEKGINESDLRLGASFYRSVSVVPEALLLAEGGYANSLHDPTEGGVLGGLTEIAHASSVSIKIDVDKIPVHEVTMKFCKTLGIDPLKLISSGVLLATIPKHLVNEALKELNEKKIKASVIGEVTNYEGYLVELRGKEHREVIDEVIYEDELITLANELLHKQ